MIDITYSVFIQMANFLVLLVVLNLVLYRPIRAILKQRKERMEGLSTEAASCRQKREETDHELAEGRRQAQAEGGAFRNDLKNQALATEKEQLAKAQAKMDAESAQMEEQIKEQMGQARQDLLGKVDSFSLVAAQKILGRSF
jgi:F-type H+-transporting ATPase subunit b